MKSILIMILLSVGVAVAAPAEVEKRIKYTTSLNSMAAVVMNWYGSLITSNEQVTFITTEHQWDDYRSQYPRNITQIQITSTDLINLSASNQYQFAVNARINYKKADTEYSQLSSDIFIFQANELAKPAIKTVSRRIPKKVKAPSTSAFDPSYFKVREFAYTWLAYLDGVEVMSPAINIGKSSKQVNYTMKIGGKEIGGSIASVLEQRKQYLAKGGHLLRSLDVQISEHKPDIKVVNLILEWKGVNQAGKAVLAKIHQKIEYRVDDSDAWHVLSIKEEHLLPDIAPWVGLLC